MMVEITEVIKALEVTSNTVRGNGMGMCADTIDWAIEVIHNSLLKEKKNE